MINARHCAVAAVVAALSSAAFAQTYPTKPGRIVVPTAPGGGTDIQARLIAKYFQEAMGQAFVIDNRPGASGMIGAELVVKAPPDGYTLLLTSSYLASNVSLYKKMTFDPMRDLMPVGHVSIAPQLLVVHPSVPAHTVKELVALAKQSRGKLNGGSSGNGSVNHLALEMFKQAAGINVTHVPYKSGSPAMRALISGEVDFTFTGMLTALPPVRAKQVRPLAVTSRKRSAVLPEVPTMDSVYPGFESANWYAMFAPAGTPEAIVSKLNAEISRAVKTREIRDFIESEGAEPVGGTPQELATFFRREVERYAKVIRVGNVRVE